jgi:hypothetical protein
VIIGLRCKRTRLANAKAVPIEKFDIGGAAVEMKEWK